MNKKINIPDLERTKYSRVFLIVTDSLGIGQDLRAKEFGDQAANTLYHVSETGLLNIPTWKKLGIDSIAKIAGFNKAINQEAYTAILDEISNAKDTLAGHWEMMGIYTKIPFPVFTNTGFPQELINKLSDAFDGKKIVGNKSASGTEIIDEFADDEINNNSVIVYTSSDSVLQICGHEEHLGLEKLYQYGKKAREICSSKPEWNVGRIIVRPYIGTKGNYVRTSNRHDYAVNPPNKTILDQINDLGVEVVSIGKINDIFNGHGISKVIKSNSDDDGMDKTIDIATTDSQNQFVFVNLVDFDSKYGHRRDPEGYAENINRFDIKLAKLINSLKENDLLMITSDHGNDPTMPGSDHTRENVPLTIYSKSFTDKPKSIGKIIGFDSIGQIILSNFKK